MPGLPAKQEYDRSELLRLAGLSERQLRSWEKQGLAVVAERYDFGHLVALQTLVRLRQANVSTARIRKVVSAVRNSLKDVSHPLSELRIYLEGRKIRVQIGKTKMAPESGQLLLDFDRQELERLVDFPAGRVAAEREKAEQLKRQQEADHWFQVGLEAERKGRPAEEAIGAYECALALDPKLSAAMVNLGTIHFSRKKFTEAEKYYRRAIECNPDYPLAHFNLAILSDEKGDRATALCHYLSALRLDPAFSDAHYNLALLYQAAGQYMKAVQHWKTYLKLDPNSVWSDVARRELNIILHNTVLRGERAAAGARSGGMPGHDRQT